jgi:pimeloyl-ACP methyl ester carboxylesterase
MVWLRSCTTAMCLVLVPTISSGQDRFFDSTGVRVRYVEQGTGEAIVLLHGVGGSLDTWIQTGRLQELAADYRVIAFDARGHGKSGKPHDPKQYGREMGLDVVRLLDHLRIARAHIVGYSMGGQITSQLLTLHPERFLTATLVAGAGRFQWTPDQQREAEQEALERERECVSRMLIYRLAPIGEPKPSEADIKARSKACLADVSQDRFAIAALTRARGDQAITPAQVSAVKVPTLGIVGSLDGNLVGLQNLKKLRPDVRVVVVEGATHTGERGILRRPEFMADLREFIAAHRRLSSR